MGSKRMRVGRRLVLVMAALCAFAEPVVAQGRAAGRETQLVAEGARLRTELEKANAQISSLKRSEPGLRNEYRLRRWQADAEQLARKLTAVEAELRGLRAGPPRPATLAAPGEAAEPPAALEARADLLTD